MLEHLLVDDQRSTAANLRRGWVRNVVLAAAVGLVYFLCVYVTALGLRFKGVSCFTLPLVFPQVS
jgi:hypothetical protein